MTITTTFNVGDKVYFVNYRTYVSRNIYKEKVIDIEPTTIASGVVVEISITADVSATCTNYKLKCNNLLKLNERPEVEVFATKADAQLYYNKMQEAYYARQCKFREELQKKLEKVGESDVDNN